MECINISVYKVSVYIKGWTGESWGGVGGDKGYNKEARQHNGRV